jgi:hypothetical protein
MIRIKIGEQGGYVVGDGPCPFDPDEFMTLFMDKIIEAKRAGLTEIGIPDELITAEKCKVIEEFQALPTVEIEESTLAMNKSRIIAALNVITDTPPLSIPDLNV